MRSKILIDLLKILLSFFLVWWIFTYFPILKGGRGVSIPVEKEERIGDAIVEQLFRSGTYEEVEDSVVEGAMKKIEGRLVEQVGLTDFEHDIRVVKSDRVNAFTLPGGHILLCSGLIEMSENPGEVAAVIAHEMGHVEKRHVIEQLERELGRSLLLSAIGGGGDGLLGNIASSSISAKFRREQEREADRYALRLMEKSGVHPNSLGKLFQRMRDEKYSGVGAPEFLMSHPDMNSRIKKAFEYEPDAGFEHRSFGIDWEKVKEKVE